MKAEIKMLKAHAKRNSIDKIKQRAFEQVIITVTNNVVLDQLPTSDETR